MTKTLLSKHEIRQIGVYCNCEIGLLVVYCVINEGNLLSQGMNLGGNDERFNDF